MYLYILQDDYAFQSPYTFPSDLIFEQGGNVWMVIRSTGLIEIRKGYAWNGNDPKFQLFGRVYGTPEFEETKNASMVHDALLQFFEHRDMPFSRKEVDLIFYTIMVMDGFRYADTYYMGVRSLGGLYGLRNEL